MPRRTTPVIWLDLDNSPHVLFFTPILGELHRRGFETFVTARDCFQVCELAALKRLRFVRVGQHYGRRRTFKILGTLWRALLLRRAVMDVKL